MDVSSESSPVQARAELQRVREPVRPLSILPMPDNTSAAKSTMAEDWYCRASANKTYEETEDTKIYELESSPLTVRRTDIVSSAKPN